MMKVKGTNDRQAKLWALNRIRRQRNGRQRRKRGKPKNGSKASSKRRGVCQPLEKLSEARRCWKWFHQKASYATNGSTIGPWQVENTTFIGLVHLVHIFNPRSGSAVGSGGRRSKAMNGSACWH